MIIVASDLRDVSNDEAVEWHLCNFIISLFKCPARAIVNNFSTFHAALSKAVSKPFSIFFLHPLRHKTLTQQSIQVQYHTSQENQINPYFFLILSSENKTDLFPFILTKCSTKLKHNLSLEFFECFLENCYSIWIGLHANQSGTFDTHLIELKLKRRKPLPAPWSQLLCAIVSFASRRFA